MVATMTRHFRTTEEDARYRRRQGSIDAARQTLALGAAYEPMATELLPTLAALMQSRIQRAGRRAGTVMGAVEVYRQWKADPASLRDWEGNQVEIDPVVHERMVMRIRATDRLESPTACECRD